MILVCKLHGYSAGSLSCEPLSHARRLSFGLLHAQLFGIRVALLVPFIFSHGNPSSSSAPVLLVVATEGCMQLMYVLPDRLQAGQKVGIASRIVIIRLLSSMQGSTHFRLAGQYSLPVGQAVLTSGSVRLARPGSTHFPRVSTASFLRHQTFAAVD